MPLAVNLIPDDCDHEPGPMQIHVNPEKPEQMNGALSRWHRHAGLPEWPRRNKFFGRIFVSISYTALTARHLVLARLWLKLDSMVPRILIVDDERDFIELVQFRLAGLGCEFIVANDGVQALSQARQFKPNLILLDILLPDLDGLSVCEILRRQPSTKKIPDHFHERAFQRRDQAHRGDARRGFFHQAAGSARG